MAVGEQRSAISDQENQGLVDASSLLIADR
jgi:hypothetical protein